MGPGGGGGGGPHGAGGGGPPGPGGPGFLGGLSHGIGACVNFLCCCWLIRDCFGGPLGPPGPPGGPPHH